MSRASLAAIGFAGLFAAAPASAQLDDLTGAAEEAVSMLKGAAADALLVGDLIGADVLGPSGEVVGTVDNLVAIPGGTLVAVIVDPSGDGQRFPIPYKAAKLSSTAQKTQVVLPEALDAFRDSAAVADLTDALGDLAPND